MLCDLRLIQYGHKGRRKGNVHRVAHLGFHALFLTCSGGNLVLCLLVWLDLSGLCKPLRFGSGSAKEHSPDPCKGPEYNQRRFRDYPTLPKPARYGKPMYRIMNE